MRHRGQSAISSIQENKVTHTDGSPSGSRGQNTQATSSSHPHPQGDTLLNLDTDFGSETEAEADKEDQSDEGVEVKSFYLPRSFLHSLLSLPAQIVFAVAGLFGLAQYARQIVRVAPKGSESAPAGMIKTASGELGVKEWVEKNMPALTRPFMPTWWLPSGHLQTMYCVVGDFTKIDQVSYERTCLRVPDGGTLGLDFTPDNFESLPEDTPTIVVCHGLTGGSHESYVRNILSWVIKPKEDGGMGARAVVINFRGCAGVPVTSPQFYSAGTTIDLATSLHYLRALYPKSPLHGIGFSLGASVLSRYLGETGSKSLLSSGIVLACPWDLPRMSEKLETHWFLKRVYSPAMSNNILRMFLKNYQSDPAVFDDPNGPAPDLSATVKRMAKGRHPLRAVDDAVVSQIGGPRNIGLWPFKDAQEYYTWASPRGLIQDVRVPLLSVNAFDDPIVDGASLPVDEIANSSHVYAAISGGGGHLGWFEGNKAQKRWVLEPASQWFTAAARDLGITAFSAETENGGEHGWTFVKQLAHPVSGIGNREGGGGGRLGWRVLREGEFIRGEESSGALQGL